MTYLCPLHVFVLHSYVRDSIKLHLSDFENHH